MSPVLYLNYIVPWDLYIDYMTYVKMMFISNSVLLLTSYNSFSITSWYSASTTCKCSQEAIMKCINSLEHNTNFLRQFIFKSVMYAYTVNY